MYSAGFVMLGYMRKKEEWVIGVDEVGRGPLAGPIAVGAILFHPDFKWGLLRGVRDSKLLSERAREEWFRRMKKWEKEGLVRHIVTFTSASVIDRFGISRATQKAVYRAVRKLAPKPGGVWVRLDGLLRAPAEYVQETVIHGDSLVPAISLASIAAKVRRDRLMKRLSKQFPEYDFDVHRGYGTAAHYKAIKRSGLCTIHRRSFLRKVL